MVRTQNGSKNFLFLCFSHLFKDFDANVRQNEHNSAVSSNAGLLYKNTKKGCKIEKSENPSDFPVTAFLHIPSHNLFFSSKNCLSLLKNSSPQRVDKFLGNYVARYIILLCIALLSGIYPLPAMHSLLVTSDNIG